MNILLTGGAGYKGLPLAAALIAQGHAVTILDCFLSGMDAALHLSTHPRITIIRKDIRTLDARDVQGYEVVYHLAGLSGYPACAANPHAAYTINAHATQHLVNLLDPAQLLIYASTTSIYGVSSDVVDETSPINPERISVYARTKYQGEQAVCSREHSIALRFATVFGVAPRMRTDLLPNDFTRRAVQERVLVLFESRSIRTFLHLDDVVAAYLLALDQADTMRGQVWNVGAEHLNLSKREIADAVAEQVDYTIVDSTLVDPDGRDFRISFAKIAALGYRPQRTLDDGIADLVHLYQWYRPESGVVL